MPDAVPDPHETQVLQAISWLRNNFVNHAESALRQVLAAAPDNLRARRLHGIALYKLGRVDEGVPAWFIGRDPDLAAHAAGALRKGPLADVDLYGASFWMRMT